MTVTVPKYDVGEAECVHDTPRAICVKLVGRGETANRWIPQSAVDEDSEVYATGHRGKLIIAKWLAKKLGLVHEECKPCRQQARAAAKQRRSGSR